MFPQMAPLAESRDHVTGEVEPWGIKKLKDTLTKLCPT